MITFIRLRNGPCLSRMATGTHATCKTDSWWEAAIQPGAQPGALWWAGGWGWGGGREAHEGGAHVYTWLGHEVVQRKPTQHCKAIIFQSKKKTKTDIRFCQMLCLHLLRWLYNFLLIMSIWQIILIYFLMLNQFCIPRINPTYPQCSFLFQYIAELWSLKHWKSLCRFALFLFKIFDR